MPKVPIDYAKTQIYKYVCNDSSVLCEYVGSTTSWNKRKQHHKERCNNEKNKKYHLKLYEIMRANGGFNNWKMILIEDYPCKSKREAEQREQHYMDLLVEKMNTIRAFRQEEQILKIKATYSSNYRKKNPEQIKEYKEEYNKKQFYCECCKNDFNLNHKARHERSQTHILNMAVLTDQDAKVENK
jgi:hypothetical protein